MPVEAGSGVFDKCEEFDIYPFHQATFHVLVEAYQFSTFAICNRLSEN